MRSSRRVPLVMALAAVLLMPASLGCGHLEGSIFGDVMAVASGNGAEVLVKRALIIALKQTGLQAPDNFVQAIFTFQRDQKEAARLFLEGARENGLDREGSNRILEIIAGTASVAEMAGGGKMAHNIKEFAMYMRGYDATQLAVAGVTGILVASAGSGGPSLAQAPARDPGAYHPEPLAAPVPAAAVPVADDLPVQSSANFLPAASQHRAESESANRAARGKSGFMYVRTRPRDAEITVTSPAPQRKSVSVKGWDVSTVAAGCSMVHVSAPKHEATSGMVCVRPDEVSRVEVALRPRQPAVGRITVISTPTEAAVYLDGRLAGLSPWTIDDVEEGSHQVRIEAPGLAWEGPVVASAGDVVVVRATLSKPVPATQLAALPGSRPVERGPARSPSEFSDPARATGDAGVGGSSTNCRELCLRYATFAPRSTGRGEKLRAMSACSSACGKPDSGAVVACLNEVTNDGPSAARCDALIW